MFFADEEPQTWPGYLAESASALVGQGIELPLCLLTCAGELIGSAIEFVSSGIMWLVLYLALEEWWNLEWTLLTLILVTDVPVIVYRSRSQSWIETVTSVHMFAEGILVMAAVFQLLMGIQGGVVFGGKLFFPSLVVVAVMVQLSDMTLKLVLGEIYGHGPDAKPDPKVARVFNYVRLMCQMEVVLFMSIATFGLPSLDLTGDLTPWLSAVPVIICIREQMEYEKSTPKDEAADTNGIPPQLTQTEDGENKDDKKAEAEEENENKEDTKKEDTSNKVDAPSGEEKKDKEKEVNEKKEDGDKKKEGETKKEPSAVERKSGTITAAVDTVMVFLFEIWSKIVSLPWECITDVVLGFGLRFTCAYGLWVLTEDETVVGVQVGLMALLLIFDWLYRDVSKDVKHLVHGAAHVAQTGLQFYVYRTHITPPV